MRIVLLKFPGEDVAFCEKICDLAEKLAYDVEAVVSLDKREPLTSFRGYPVRPLRDIIDLSWDVAICVCSTEIFDTVIPNLLRLKIGRQEQFKNCYWLLQQFMIKKYEDCADPSIQETIAYWRTHELTIFNHHLAGVADTVDELFIDKDCGLPYLIFKTAEGKEKRMYYPRGRATRDGEKAIENLLQEQAPTSPHLYTTGNHKVNAGDILIDAGVCEGNFALKYVDLCSKIYLFEPNTQWLEPLNQTFKDYRDKVEIIPRYLSDVTDGENITIDDALPDLRGENIFLKMDIESAEPFALRGAKRILTNNHVRASICTYHRADDLVKVKSILQKYGYKTSTSEGYMIFIYDPNIFDTADFRKGIVYAEN